MTWSICSCVISPGSLGLVVGIDIRPSLNTVRICSPVTLVNMLIAFVEAAFSASLIVFLTASATA